MQTQSGMTKEEARVHVINHSFESIHYFLETMNTKYGYIKKDQICNCCPVKYKDKKTGEIHGRNFCKNDNMKKGYINMKLLKLKLFTHFVQNYLDCSDWWYYDLFEGKYWKEEHEDRMSGWILEMIDWPITVLFKKYSDLWDEDKERIDKLVDDGLEKYERKRRKRRKEEQITGKKRKKSNYSSSSESESDYDEEGEEEGTPPKKKRKL